MRYLLFACTVLVGCSNPIAPGGSQDTGLCDIPTGPITLRVQFMGHISNRPLAGLPAHLRATGCNLLSTTTDANGVAEWRVPTGVYLVEFRHTAYFVDSEVTQDVQWLLSFPE